MKKVFLSFICALLGLCGRAEKPAATTVQHPEWSRNAVIYEVNLRQFTPEGTIEAFRSHLPRLRDLGVDILWLMPVHPISEDGRKGELGSYYAVKDYKAVNPEFGTMADFRKMVDEAHALGMKVIIDWVPNHSGRDNAWVAEHPDWYARDEQGNMFGPFDWTDVYKFDYSVPEMRAAMTDAMQYWLREGDIDGFRCDVAGQVPVSFWDENRPKLEEVKSDIFMLAEATEPELMLHAFDMDYNWPMKDLFSAIAATQGQYTFVNPQGHKQSFEPAHATDIYALLNSQNATYPVDSYMMNMVTNHDLNSWEGTERERLGQLHRAFAVLTYTLPGMPLIYTGQEVGLDRALEFFVKDTPPEWGSRPDVTEFYRVLNNLKHNSPELAAGVKGAPVEMLPTASPDVLAFRRGDVLTVVNLSSHENRLFNEVPATEGLSDIFTGTTVIPDRLPAGGYLVFAR
ncbi:MAG: alpha-amylase [Muribaculaceae bacterium]|nr:alpha-amylase [Muribaculaceae bacterium]